MYFFFLLLTIVLWFLLSFSPFHAWKKKINIENDTGDLSVRASSLFIYFFSTHYNVTIKTTESFIKCIHRQNLQRNAYFLRCGMWNEQIRYKYLFTTDLSYKYYAILYYIYLTIIAMHSRHRQSQNELTYNFFFFAKKKIRRET